MSVTEQQSAVPKPKRRWYRCLVLSLIVAIAFASLGVGLICAYFREARLDGSVLYSACACGLKPAKVVNGEVILIEPNHGRPAGGVVATISIEGGICTHRRIGENGTCGPAERLEVDHLGAKYYDKELFGSRPVYVLMTDNWKWYPFMFFTLIERLFREST